MKLKEYIPSSLQSWRLAKKPAKRMLEGKKRIPLVASVKSFAPRLHLVHLAIRSVWNDEVIPQHTVLVLHQKHRESLPNSIKELEKAGLEIVFVDNDRSHFKLLGAFSVHSSMPVVTFDDDVIYQKNWLNTLYQTHLQFPDRVVALQTRIISRSEKGDWLAYKNWPTSYQNQISSVATLPIGGAGVLYPPNFNTPELSNIKLIELLCPKADDLWFKTMGLLRNFKVVIPEDLPKSSLPIIGSQTVSLGKENIKEDRNRSQWIDLCKHFNLKI
ncbi:MAG: zinc-binding alcohol dehydrogenase [Flavobacteriaceae bacterium]|jgi:hypothetical protein|nr:zinc-binding alcohol dehydrogenase [Flavobacteriaceae bacterium]